MLADLYPVDLLKAARPVREEALPCPRLGGIGECAFLLPGRAVRLKRHVGQRVEPVLRTQFDLVDRLVVGALPLLVQLPGIVDVTVRRAVEFGRVGFERMRAELFDIDGDRRSQALRAQHVEPRRRAVGVHQRREIMLRPRLVGGDQRRRVLDGGVGTGQMGDPRFACHAVRSP